MKEASDSRLVLLEFPEKNVAVVSLNRPESLNALSTDLSIALSTMLDEIDTVAEIRTLIVTGSGDKAFCAGGDLKERLGMTSDEWTAQHRIFEAMYARIRSYRKPIIAAVNGVAVGGGAEIAMSCDFILASDTAKFGQPEVSRGLMPGGGGTQLLSRLVPRGLARELLMTGRLITAAEAHDVGLVNSVHSGQDLLDSAIATASQIASNSPIGVELAKRSVKLGIDQPLENAVEIELECYHQLVSHPDRIEGVAAFNERRKPKFMDRP